MKVRLIKKAKVWVEAGEIVDVSPADAGFLIAVGTADPVMEAAEIPEAKQKKTTRKRG